MLSFILAHLIIGALLGTWLRFGALIPAFFVVILEAVFAAQLGVMVPAYFLILAGIVALQVGYAGASYFKIYARRASERASRAALGAPKQSRAA